MRVARAQWSNSIAGEEYILPPSSSAADHTDYCADQVRRYDRDRFLTSLFAPPARRPALFALYAFNLEVAKAREVVTEPLIGQMRLQWWREAIEELYAGTPRRHEVVLALADAVRAFGLRRTTFDRLIDAREADMADEPPATLAALVDYADATSGSLTRLALQALGADAGPAHRAGRHVGIAWALAGLLRAVPFHARAGRIYLPADMLDAAGISAQSLRELQTQPVLAGVVESVARVARDHLTRARDEQGQVPRAALAALLPARLADGYLAVLRRAGWNPFDPQVAAPLPFAAGRLLLARATGRY